MRKIWRDEILSDDEPLWRYFTPERFHEAMSTRKLYFASARQFEDPFEDAVAVQPHDWPVDSRYGEMEFGEHAFEELRRLAKVSCWHRADYESDAMWKLYAGQRKGIAVRTTVGCLEKSLHPFRLHPTYGEEMPYSGSVRYLDLRKERLRTSMENRFFYKHRGFEWEREFRVMITLRSAEEFGVKVPIEGIYVGFDPGVLIQELYLGPSTTLSEREEIMKSCADLGENFRPIVSTLLGRPRYM